MSNVGGIANAPLVPDEKGAQHSSQRRGRRVQQGRRTDGDHQALGRTRTLAAPNRRCAGSSLLIPVALQVDRIVDLTRAVPLTARRVAPNDTSAPNSVLLSTVDSPRA
jgi:hypothetical protein